MDVSQSSVGQSLHSLLRVYVCVYVKAIVPRGLLEGGGEVDQGVGAVHLKHLVCQLADDPAT